MITPHKDLNEKKTSFLDMPDTVYIPPATESRIAILPPDELDKMDEKSRKDYTEEIISTLTYEYLQNMRIYGVEMEITRKK